MTTNHSINQAALGRVAHQLLKDIGARSRDEARRALVGRIAPYGPSPRLVEMALDRYFAR
ncbi:hypothetical protein [Pedomonas mirosovicensis]|uniref:hypothetical protein n=1 Tax=Pedomonas mirosovicensis TaxID=2908641 RepID=UPI00216A7156|nr:hypothetical protein [Pedomonas mirosovicensis]MCH8685493.1 hypothetical protein [Pedomonas mirosovicensis]